MNTKTNSNTAPAGVALGLFGRAAFNNAQAAEYLGISPTTLSIWRCTKRYAIPYIRVGNRIRYRKEDLDAWLASRAVGATQGAAA